MDYPTGGSGKQQTYEPTSSGEIYVQRVIQSELSQLKDKAKVYHQQPNSNIFFLSSVEKEMIRSKKALDDLMKDYQEVQDKSSK